ncbi:pacearchaeosortase [Candidatus Pacearchaeota archaeon]|nr:pacearchaeosortase [Candidatus Pacearchaeota archaeon]
MLLVSINGLFIFYYVFTPLTIYPISFIFSLFFDTYLVGNTLIMKSVSIEFIKACIAGSAYYLLLILILSTPKIEVKKRISMIFIAFLSLLVVNLIRISLLILIFLNGYDFFDITHKFFWYFMSTVFVVVIWFAEVKYFKIKEIPVYSDLKYLYEKIRK